MILVLIEFSINFVVRMKQKWSYGGQTSLVVLVKTQFETALNFSLLHLLFYYSDNSFCNVEDRYIYVGDSYLWGSRYVDLVVSLLVCLLASILNKLCKLPQAFLCYSRASRAISLRDYPKKSITVFENYNRSVISSTCSIPYLIYPGK